jgi:predicted MPP superfamily phosphohydrolase
MMAELRRLKAPLGVYACPGNHDVDRISFRERGGAPPLDRIQDFLKNAGIILLQDEVQIVDGRFYLAGRRDARPIGGNQGRKSAAELSAGLDKSLPLIFLDHQPVDFLREEEAGADLILSGHTHKGQFFPGNIATAYIFKKAGGVHYGHWRGTSSQAVVSSGAGVWGIPFRIATNSEVVIIDLKFDN